MNTKKHTNKLLIILIIVILAFIGLYLYKNSPTAPPATSVVPTETITAPTPSETNSNISDKPNTGKEEEKSPAKENTWVSYEDPGLGFSLEYPQDIFDAEPQGRGVEGGGVLLVAPDHSVPSDFSGLYPEKRQNLSVKFTVESQSMKMAIAKKQLQNLESIPFNKANHNGKIFILGAEGLNVQYGFLVLDENTTMVVEFHYYDKSVFGEASADDFTMEQQIEIFYAVIDTLKFSQAQPL